MTQFIKNFVEWGEEFIEPFKTFIQDNYSNPILWIVLLGAGLFLFTFTYESLHKNN
ncbi:MAG: hypothetical protein RSD09_03905 [Bacilli bacterium]